MANRDTQLINTVVEAWENFEKSVDGKKIGYHSLDKTVVSKLKDLADKLKLAKDDDSAIYNHSDIIKELWKDVIERSIMCLRYFDKREPFLKNTEKIPVAYGIDELVKYYDAFTDFESQLYGGNKYYRDHVIHAFRTWILGLDVLLANGGDYLNGIEVGTKIDLTCYEKTSIWSMIALMHDLGYPLEKAQQIIDKTNDMMQHFIANPSIATNLSYSGSQNEINSLVLNMISSKMQKRFDCKYEKDKCEVIDKYDGKTFVARRQSKYYFKLLKSLEKSMHGMISAIISYKLLQYFLETDFSTDEDYYFDEEEVRQFYIRREILRSIAAHTCPDIYHQNMMSFAYLLIIVDDSQDWGRRRFSDLYFGSNVKFTNTIINVKISKTETSKHETHISEDVNIDSDRSQLEHILKSHYDLIEVYKMIFKDGIDTDDRDFILSKTRNVVYNADKKSPKFELKFDIHKDKNAEFKISFDTKTDDGGGYTKDWIEKVLNMKNNKLYEIVEKSDGDNKIWSVEPNVRFNS